MDWSGERIVCHVVCLHGPADLPGKCTLQGFTQYNGLCGGSFCETKGERIPVQKGNCQVYPYLPGPPTMLRIKDKTAKDGKDAQQLAKPVSFHIQWISFMALLVSNNRNFIAIFPDSF